jgi:hypothetical protein
LAFVSDRRCLQRLPQRDFAVSARSVLACLVLTLGLTGGYADERASAMNVELSLVELAEQTGTFEVVAIVRADDDGRLLAAPHLRFPGGQTSVVAVENEAGDRISLSIGPVFRSREAQWLVVWRRGGGTIGRLTGRVSVFGAD